MTINYYNKATKRYMIFKYKVLPTLKTTAIVTLLIGLHAIASTVTQ